METRRVDYTRGHRDDGDQIVACPRCGEPAAVLDLPGEAVVYYIHTAVLSPRPWLARPMRTLGAFCTVARFIES